MTGMETRSHNLLLKVILEEIRSLQVIEEDLRNKRELTALPQEIQLYPQQVVAALLKDHCK